MTAEAAPHGGLRHYVPRVLQTWDDVHPGRVATVTGSVISIDLVGFTPLSESLAELGKRGAEELVALLNEVFTELIAVSDDHGGDVLTFGGDALTILTDGPGHAQRAVAAATAMGQVMRVVRSTPSIPEIRLAMSTGISSGPVWLFTIEPGHRDMLVTGPTITNALNAESLAAAGQVLVTDSTAGQLPIGWVEPDPRRGLHRARTDRSGTSSVAMGDLYTGAGDLTCLALLPAPLSELARTGLAVGEHRLTTIAFIGLEGLDDAIEAGHADDVQDQLDRWSVHLADALSSTGVHWLQADTHPGGAKLLLAAGAPTSTGHDERAMLLALRQITDGAGDLSIKIGASRGRTFGGFVGSDTSRRSYSSMGDYTNIAARLMGKAPPGGILATANLVEHAGSGVQADPVPPLVLKGKSAPLAAALVGAVERSERTVDRHGPFVGREEPLAALIAMADAAREGAGQVGTVNGAAGLGKSRLVEEALAARPDLRTVRVLAERFDRSRAFLIARLLLRRLDPALQPSDDSILGHVRAALGDDEDLAPLLGDVLGIDLGSSAAVEDIDPAFRLQQTAQIAARVALAAIDEPTAAVVEDLEWIDGPSLLVLEAMARQRGTTPVLLLATSRDSQTTLPDATTIDLKPLRATQAAELARGADEAVPDHALRALVERADGNPLFVLELMRVIDGGVDDLPDTLEALVTARLDQLEPVDRLPLLDASVLGVDIPLELLRDVRQADVPEGWVDRISDFVATVAPDRLSFTQDLYRTTAYGSLSYQRRRTLHRRTGLALEGVGDDPAVLALHFDRGGDDARAWKYGVMSGRAAEDAHAAAEAAAIFTAALAHAETLHPPATEVADVREHRGNVRELTGAFTAALEDFDAARGLLDDPVAHSRLQRKAALVEMRLGQKDHASARYADGLAAAEGVDDPVEQAALRAAIQIGQAGIAYREGRYGDGVDVALAAVHGAVDGGDQPALAHAFQLLDLCMKADGRPSPYDGWAAPMFAAAGDLVGEGNALNNEGIAAYYAGRWDDALDAYRRSEEVRARAGDLLGQAMSANNIGEVLSDQGRLAEAEAIFAGALRDWQSIGYAIGMGIATSNLGRVAVRRGNVADGRTLLTDAKAQLTQIEANQFALEAEGRLAEADLADGSATVALQRLETLSATVQVGAVPAVDVWLARLRGQALLHLDRDAEGRMILTDAATSAEAAEIPYEQMWAAHLLGDIQTRDELATRLGVDVGSAFG